MIKPHGRSIPQDHSRDSVGYNLELTQGAVQLENLCDSTDEENVYFHTLITQVPSKKHSNNLQTDIGTSCWNESTWSQCAQKW